jgi:cytidine deaminase
MVILTSMAERPKKTTTRFDADDEALIAGAFEMLERAYSPYSKVKVGAVLRAHDGRTFSGCNVENASLGLTWCAERTALVKAVSEGVREFKTLAIATSLEQAIMPCGACRQVLFEFAPFLRVLVAGQNGQRHETYLEDLLPEAFGPADLK